MGGLRGGWGGGCRGRGEEEEREEGDDLIIWIYHTWIAHTFYGSNVLTQIDICHTF